MTALMAEIDRQTVLDSITASRLRLNTLPFLEKQLELMGDGIESLYLEVQDVTKYERARVRMEQAKAAWLARRQEVWTSLSPLRLSRVHRLHFFPICMSPLRNSSSCCCTGCAYMV